MSTKLKALGLASTAALVACALVSTSAFATGTGHFTFLGSDHALIAAEQEGANAKFTDPTLPAVECVSVLLAATAASETVTEPEFGPTLNECSTKNGKADISINQCRFRVTIETHAETTYNKVHLICPGETKHIVIQSTNIFGTCTIKIGPQVASGGLTYTTKGESGKGHDVTVDVAITGIVSNRHADGFNACQGVGTLGGEGALVGTLTARAFDTTESEQISLTATGFTGA